jgi:hypothetical protein
VGKELGLTGKESKASIGQCSSLNLGDITALKDSLLGTVEDLPIGPSSTNVWQRKELFHRDGRKDVRTWPSLSDLPLDASREAKEESILPGFWFGCGSLSSLLLQDCFPGHYFLWQNTCGTRVVDGP